MRSSVNSLLKEANQMGFVTVKVQASDEQIMSDFRHWLTEYRKFTGIEQPRKKFTDKDLSRWFEYRILPYMDLTMIAKLQNKTISYAKIAGLIFPDEYEIDRVERIKKTTKSEAEKIIKLFFTS